MQPSPSLTYKYIGGSIQGQGEPMKRLPVQYYLAVPVLLLFFFGHPLYAFCQSGKAILTTSSTQSAWLLTESGKFEGYLTSPSGKYHLIMQMDGRLALFEGETMQDRSKLLWSVNGAPGFGDYFLNMQNDGNLAIWRGKPMTASAIADQWTSGTPGLPGNYFLMVQDDGNVVIYRGTGPQDNQGVLWSRLHGKVPLAQTQSDSRIKIGEMSITPCSKVEWRQVYNATTKIGEQKVAAYLHVNAHALNAAKQTIENCAKQATAAATISAIFTSASAALPAFKLTFGSCLASSNIDRGIAESISLSTETTCHY